MGQCLLGDNPSQRFLLITGTAGGGKSTLVNVIEQLVTRQNCTELRLEHMHGRFENSRLVGKTLLTGKDVKAGFLDSKGAPMLKALTGKDILSTEFKHSNSAIEIEGRYNVIITSNATLQVRLENDAAAWKRRMLWIKYENQPPAIPIENFDQLLIREEGSGILNFALDGARELLSQGGKIKLFPAQEKRIDALLEDTDPVRLFIRECLVPEAGANVSQKELWMHFNRYITLHELDPIKQSAFRKILPDLMEQELHVTCRHDIMQDGRAVRGYANVTFKS